VTKESKKESSREGSIEDCEFIQKHELAAIVLPNDDIDRELMDSITNALYGLGLIVFLVGEMGVVRI
jgi:hypothetical protein